MRKIWFIFIFVLILYISSISASQTFLIENYNKTSTNTQTVTARMGSVLLSKSSFGSCDNLNITGLVKFTNANPTTCRVMNGDGTVVLVSGTTLSGTNCTGINLKVNVSTKYYVEFDKGGASFTDAYVNIPGFFPKELQYFTVLAQNNANYADYHLGGNTSDYIQTLVGIIVVCEVIEAPPAVNQDSIFLTVDKNSSTNDSVWFNVSIIGNFTYLEVWNNSNLLYNGSNNFLNVTGIGNNTQINFNVTGRWNYTLYNNTYFNLTSLQTEQYIAPETFKINISWSSPVANFNHSQHSFVNYILNACCDSSAGTKCESNVSIDPTEKHILTNGSGTVVNNILTINTWDTMHDAVVGTETILNYWVLSTYNAVLEEGQINRIFLPFNTSVLPDNAIISDAKLYFHVSDSVEGNIYLVGETKQESTSNLIIEDFDQCGAIDNPVLMADVVVPPENSWSYFTLNSNGINNISKTGITKFGIRSYYDYGDIDPSGDTETYTIDDSDIYLNITYTIPEEESNATSKGLINTTEGDLPFYTTTANPYQVNISDGTCVNVTFAINATGTVGDSYQFFGNVTLADNATMNYGTDTINVTITAAQAEDSCTYQGSGTWTLLCSDNCTITQTVDLGSNTLLITGEGTTVFTYKPVNFDKMSVHGDSASNICKVRIG